MEMFYLIIGGLFGLAAGIFSHNKISTIDFIVLAFLMSLSQACISLGLK
jgi:hypothetical protein